MKRSKSLSLQESVTFDAASAAVSARASDHEFVLPYLLSGGSKRRRTYGQLLSLLLDTSKTCDIYDVTEKDRTSARTKRRRRMNHHLLFPVTPRGSGSAFASHWSCSLSFLFLCLLVISSATIVFGFVSPISSTSTTLYTYRDATKMRRYFTKVGSAGRSCTSLAVAAENQRTQLQKEATEASEQRVAELADTSTASNPDLASRTVKELKQMVKDLPQPIERGLLSQLKRKQDFIDHLRQRQQQQLQKTSANCRTSNSTIAITGTPKLTPAQSHSLKVPLNMPSLENNDEETEVLTVTESPVNDALISSSPVSESTVTTKSNPKKDKLFEKVFQRYPPIREQYQHAMIQQLQQDEKQATAGPLDEGSEHADDDVDVRQKYHPIFENMPAHLNSCDMDIVFVGTASCTPGITRGVSCTALRLNWKRRAAFQEPQNPNNNQSNNLNGSGFQGGTWLFDVGESTQLQVQRTSNIKPSKITKIFLTHAHGDHSFGLPGLLCLMGQDRDRNAGGQPIDIYGPEGLRKYLRVAIRFSVSRIVPPYRVHELREVPMAPEWQYNARSGRYYYNGLNGNDNDKNQQRTKTWGRQGLSGEDPNSWITQSDQIHLAPSLQYGEVKGGRDIYPIYQHPLSSDGAPVWEVEDEEDVKVYAAPMSHGIPCVGYVIEEASRPGRLRNEIVQPLVMENIEGLKDAGLKIPMKALAVIKNLPIGSSFTFPDGTVITQEEAVEPPRKGRKVAIMGDTASCRSMEVLAKDCDVLVHEATNAYLPGIDRDTNLRSVTRDAVVHGHSTPELAGLFAKKVNAKRLLLNHFSARYKGDASADSLSIMMRIENFAMATSGLDETRVAAAWDLMLFPIRSHE